MNNAIIDALKNLAAVQQRDCYRLHVNNRRQEILSSLYRRYLTELC